MNMQTKIHCKPKAGYEIAAPARAISRSCLKPDCGQCFGLCCVALYFSAGEGFPVDKEAGKPCIHLQPDFRCRVHDQLADKALKGCLTFDCFGAGQKVSQVTFKGKDWLQAPAYAVPMFDAFLIMRQLHEMLWLLIEALALPSAGPIHGGIHSLLIETENLTFLGAEAVLTLDLAAHREKVSRILLEASELERTNVRSSAGSSAARKKALRPGADWIGADLRKYDLRGISLRGACLIAADLRGADLTGTDLIGADLRDADLCGTNLAKSLFLTQAQINGAKGDIDTKLPDSLEPPAHWSN